MNVNDRFALELGRTLIRALIAEAALEQAEEANSGSRMSSVWIQAHPSRATLHKRLASTASAAPA